MSFEFKIDYDLTKTFVFLDRVKKRAARKAVKQALNKTIRSTRTQLNKSFRQQRKLKLKDINHKYTSLERATGMSINDMEASITIAAKSLSLIHFVRGSKLPRKQKGIKVSKRRPLKFEVKASKIKKRDKLFIARGKNNNVHVFRRKGKKLIKQNAPGLKEVFIRSEVNRPIKLFARKTFGREFARAFSYQLSKIKT